MKPFVAIDGVLDYLLFIFFRCISVEDCAKSEIACCPYGPVRGWNLGCRVLSNRSIIMENALPQFAVWAQSSKETDPKLPKYLAKSKKIVQHPVDRDNRLHVPSLPSARVKQSAQPCSPTSVLSVAPF